MKGLESEFCTKDFIELRISCKKCSEISPKYSSLYFVGPKPAKLPCEESKTSPTSFCRSAGRTKCPAVSPLCSLVLFGAQNGDKSGQRGKGRAERDIQGQCEKRPHVGSTPFSSQHSKELLEIPATNCPLAAHFSHSYRRPQNIAYTKRQIKN